MYRLSLYQHRFLLRNDDEFSTISSGEVHRNWYSYQIDNVSCSSQRFTNWYVHDVAGTMHYYNGMWYYRDVKTNSIKCAKEIVGKIVYVNRNDIVLSDGMYFIQDLIGMRVYDVDDKDVYYGKVVDVLQPGANDVYRIVDDNNAERLIPVIDDVVIDVELDNNVIYIRPLEGLFYD